MPVSPSKQKEDYMIQGLKNKQGELIYKLTQAKQQAQFHKGQYEATMAAAMKLTGALELLGEQIQEYEASCVPEVPAEAVEEQEVPAE